MLVNVNTVMMASRIYIRRFILFLFSHKDRMSAIVHVYIYSCFLYISYR